MKLIYAITSQEPFFGNLNQSIEVHFFKSESHLSFWKRTTSTRISVPKPPKSQICHLKEREERGQGHNLWGKIDHQHYLIFLACHEIHNQQFWHEMYFERNHFAALSFGAPISLMYASLCFIVLFHDTLSSKQKWDEGGAGKKNSLEKLAEKLFLFSIFG